MKAVQGHWRGVELTWSGNGGGGERVRAGVGGAEKSVSCTALAEESSGRVVQPVAAARIVWPLRRVRPAGVCSQGV